MVETETFQKGSATRNRRFYVCSRATTAVQAAAAIRAHWAIETSLHWVLDVTFREDKARGHTGNGPANMAVVRHFAFNLLRIVDDNRSIKLRRKRAARNNRYLQTILNLSSR
jgi:predicted transposase YbfD/YdcC